MANDFRNYTYDNMGELRTAIGEDGVVLTNRWQEQFGSLMMLLEIVNIRTNNTLIQTFAVNVFNELTITTNVGRLTVVGTTTSPATNVTVNTSNAVLYADTMFASTTNRGRAATTPTKQLRGMPMAAGTPTASQ